MNELPNANKFVPLTEAEFAAVSAIGGSVQDDIVRIAKAREIFAGAVPIAGTPAAMYLQSRGIDPTNLVKGVVGWHKRSSAIVFVARDGAGSISACQRVFLTAEGKKAQVQSSARMASFVARPCLCQAKARRWRAKALRTP